MPRTVYLVGSIPASSAEAAMRSVGGRLGRLLEWLPDGETGERLDWITWLEPIFRDDPALMPSGKVFRVHAGADPHVRYTLRPGKTPADVTFANLFYADHAIASFAVFTRLKREGVIPGHVKFQVDLVPAHSVLWLYIEDELQAALDPLYNAAVKREIEKLAAAIPARELAIQFDVASAVFARLQRGEASSYGASKADMQGRFADIIADLAGIAADKISAGLVKINDARWHGYLANVTTDEYEREFLAKLPVEISGLEFLDIYGGTTDAVTKIDPARIYAVKAPTEHAIYENSRVQKFAKMLNDADLNALGLLMFQSHKSYAACGLTESRTDRIVELVRQNCGKDLFGARITGGGSGGTVVVLASRGSRSTIEQLADTFAGETKQKPYIFHGSSPGCATFGFLRLSSV